LPPWRGFFFFSRVCPALGVQQAGERRRRRRRRRREEEEGVHKSAILEPPLAFAPWRGFFFSRVCPGGPWCQQAGGGGGWRRRRREEEEGGRGQTVAER